MPSGRHISYDTASHQGFRDYQEDRMDLIPNIVPGIHYFGMFDGHGRKHGHGISSFLQANMGEVVKSTLVTSRSKNLQRILQTAFHTMTTLIQENSEALHARHNGSTATVLLMDTVKNTLAVAYCGDSLCLCAVPTDRRIGFLTPVMHKVETESEKQRLLQRGATLDNSSGMWRVISETYQVNLSRSFGDLALSPALTSLPEILLYDMPASAFTIVLATDGLWDVMDHNIVQNVMDSVRPGVINAQMLSNISQRFGTQDNTSVIVVQVN